MSCCTGQDQDKTRPTQDHAVNPSQSHTYVPHLCSMMLRFSHKSRLPPLSCECCTITATPDKPRHLLLLCSPVLPSVHPSTTALCIILKAVRLVTSVCSTHVDRVAAAAGTEAEARCWWHIAGDRGSLLVPLPVLYIHVITLTPAHPLLFTPAVCNGASGASTSLL